jgi:DNA polymerase-4
MDAFFASVEEVLNPQLVTKSIIIACNFDERSVVSTCNYRARKYGVKSGMSLKKAIKKCPRAVICQPNFDKYQYFHNKFIKLIKKFCSKIEIVSIDECYLDVTDLCKKDSITPINLAIKIQSSVLKNTKLSCSIGIGDNRFMAKLACGMQKPHGITILSKKDLVDKI